MRARLVVAAMLLAPPPADAAPDRGTEANARCDATQCMWLVPGLSQEEICFPDIPAPPARGRRRATAPHLERADRTVIRLTWSAARSAWCAAIDPAQTLVVVDGKRRRPVRITVVRDLIDDAERSSGWTDVDGPLMVNGEVVDEPTLEVIGGQPTPEPARPSAARLRDDIPDDQAFLDVVLVGGADAYHCTGIAVAADAILTAGHCAPATRVGLAARTERVLATAAVVATVRHPVLDAALLRLDAPLPVVVRRRRSAADTTSPQTTVRMIGFGVDAFRTSTGFGVKRRADVPVVGWGCDGRRAATTGCRAGAEMVLTAVGGRDTCWGDSGGPVLESVDGSWRLVAITSRPVAHADAACGRGGIYVRLDALDTWLKATLEATP